MQFQNLNVTLNGEQDVFVSKLNLNGEIEWIKVIGGNLTDHACGITVNNENKIFIMIGSKSSDFPMINSINNTHGGNWDTGIAEFSNNGTLLFSTYFGGSGQDLGTEIIMNNNDLYLFGYTQSEDIPIINSSTNYSGLGDAFFAKFHFYPTTPTTTSLSISITTETDTVITSVVNNSPPSTSDQSNSDIKITSYQVLVLLFVVTRLKKKKFTQ